MAWRRWFCRSWCLWSFLSDYSEVKLMSGNGLVTAFFVVAALIGAVVGVATVLALRALGALK